MIAVPASPPAVAVRVEGVAPIFPVRDLAASVAYYCDVLGFQVAWQDPGILAAVSLDRAQLWLCEGDQGHPGTWVWFGVDDAAAYFAQVVARGATVRVPPTNYPWALECQLLDPDGNVLRFGSEPLDDRPLGPWRDMRGQVWVRTPDGGWQREESSPESP